MPVFSDVVQVGKQHKYVMKAINPYVKKLHIYAGGLSTNLQHEKTTCKWYTITVITSFNITGDLGDIDDIPHVYLSTSGPYFLADGHLAFLLKIKMLSDMSPKIVIQPNNSRSNERPLERG